MTSSTHTLDSREGLLQELVAIEAAGWGSVNGERLLSYVRDHIVRPQVAAAGLRGPAADQAEATGWAVAWETLNRTSIHTAGSPWGVLWVAVRKAIAGERLAADYQASVRNSGGLRTRAWNSQRPAGRGRSPDHSASACSSSKDGSRRQSPGRAPHSADVWRQSSRHSFTSAGNGEPPTPS